MVTLEELKAHLRIEHGDEDTHLSLLLRAAQGAAEDFCRVDSFENDGGLPEPVRLAILLHTSHFSANRENGQVISYQAMTQAFHALLWPYRNPDKLV